MIHEIFQQMALELGLGLTIWVEAKQNVVEAKQNGVVIP